MNKASRSHHKPYQGRRSQCELAFDYFLLLFVPASAAMAVRLTKTMQCCY